MGGWAEAAAGLAWKPPLPPVHPQAHTQAPLGQLLTPSSGIPSLSSPSSVNLAQPGRPAFAQCSVVATQTVTVTRSTHLLSACSGKGLGHSSDRAEASLLSGPEHAMAACVGFPAGIF